MARGGYKVKRGGGRSKHLELDENGTAVSKDKWARRDKDIDEDSEEGSEEEKEESSEEESDEAPSSTQPQQELTRGDEDEGSDQEPILANPNIAAGKKLNIADLGSSRELTRRERDEKEKKEAKERYWKLHEQGKTEEAKSDLARLAKIRAEREAAQAKRKAETEAKASELEAKKREAASKGKRI
ncbi:casein kinase substrate phosphoprotein PP28-domain-containing protein [Fomitopsis serialis]|uniref:casein kinase substrate phosphoprotein PP28-domain-containing protein n=1 Tax=Fomitopsis serialis TaxID=139415 RepID=UPI0020078890|nr:casein kinase substrate phosphoprotein PP28-domain-containing protein [Neoantrodia serialis]KAH9921128.1 casein kinase substrate phosphoprotein PP28-domain-containing protein [Neoantrodia serialis]